MLVAQYNRIPYEVQRKNLLAGSLQTTMDYVIFFSAVKVAPRHVAPRFAKRLPDEMDEVAVSLLHQIGQVAVSLPDQIDEVAVSLPLQIDQVAVWFPGWLASLLGGWLAGELVGWVAGWPVNMPSS